MTPGQFAGEAGGSRPFHLNEPSASPGNVECARHSDPERFDLRGVAYRSIGYEPAAP